MEFKAQTKTVRYSPPTAEVIAQIDARSATLADQGLTDGQKHYILLPNGEQEWTRNWTTVEAADEWISFITTYGPHSAEVIEL